MYSILCDICLTRGSKCTNHGARIVTACFLRGDVTKTGSGGRGAGKGGTEVWEQVVSGNLHKNPKWPIRIPVRWMIKIFYLNCMPMHEVP